MPIDYPQSSTTSTSPLSSTSYPDSASFEKIEHRDAYSGSDQAKASVYEQDDEQDDEDEDQDEDEYDEESAMIQAEWEESMRQLEAVFSIVLIPFMGKWYGRKFAFWGMVANLLYLDRLDRKEGEMVRSDNNVASQTGVQQADQ